nr:hypothetical protein [Tanacetum cinerariifolium]
MNKLVRYNLVRGLPTKSFDNDHTCTAFLKGKHHKASCKSKLVNSVTKPLYTLHMDFLALLLSKDESSDILKKFITKVENLKDYKVKIIRFEDILGVSTSSEEIIGEEDDISNMETSISASPTPTLRIHKDHPKS